MALEEAGYGVAYSKFGRQQSALERLSRRMKGRLGNLAQVVEALHSHANVLYVGDPRSLHLLAQRRYVAPIVAIVHPAAPPPGDLLYKAVGGYREVICLSHHVYEEVLRIPGRSASNTSVLPWGPDLLFPGYATYEDGGFVVAVGRQAGITLFCTRQLKERGFLCECTKDRSGHTPSFCLISSTLP